MPSITDLAAQYAEQIKKHSTSPTIIVDTAKRIKGLNYTSNGTPISDADIDALINEIESAISHKKSIPGYGMLSEAEDSTVFIQMVQSIRLEAKKK